MSDDILEPGWLQCGEFNLKVTERPVKVNGDIYDEKGNIIGQISNEEWERLEAEAKGKRFFHMHIVYCGDFNNPEALKIATQTAMHSPIYTAANPSERNCALGEVFKMAGISMCIKLQPAL